MKHFQASRRRSRRRAVAVLTAAVLSVSVSCGGTEGSTTSEDGELSVMVPIQGALLDPTQGSVQSLGTLLLGLEPLQRFQPNGELEPELATALEQPDPRTYVYTIREGVEFWDGTPLTADDVVFSIGLHVGPESKSFNSSLFTSVAEVSETGENEVTITLTDPDPQFPYVIAQTGIVSRAFYGANEVVGTPDVLNMGTGPYKFESFKPTSETTLTANKDYWGEEPTRERITVRTVGDDSTRLLAIQSGEFDGLFNVPINQLGSYEGIEGVEQVEAPDYSVYKFNFDTTKAPWDDIHLRRAVALAINREDLVTGALGGNAVLAPTLVPDDVMGSLASPEMVEETYAGLATGLEFDLEAAKEELALSSSPDGLTVKMPVTGSDPNLSAIAQTAAQTLAEIGVDLQIQEVDDNTYYEAVYFKHTTEGFTLDNFGAQTPDPASVPLYSLSSVNALPQGSGTNIAQYDNTEVDSILQESQRLDTNDPERGQLLLDALTASHEDLPYVPIAFPNVYVVGNSQLNLDEFTTFWWLTEWSELS